MKRTLLMSGRVSGRMSAPISATAAFLLCWSAVAWGQGAYKTEPVGPLNSPDVPKALEEKLQAQGARLVSDKERQ